MPVTSQGDTDMTASLASSRPHAHATHQNPPLSIDPGRYFVAPGAVAFAAPQAGLGKNREIPPSAEKHRPALYRPLLRQAAAQRLVAGYWAEHSINLRGSSVIGCGRWKIFGQVPQATIKLEGGEATLDGHFVCGCSWTCEQCARAAVARNRSWLRAALFPALKAAGKTGSLVTLTLAHSYGTPWEVPVTALKRAYALMDRRMAKWYRKVGSVGKFKTFEVTIGRSGLHPHFHILLTHDINADIELLKSAMQAAWFKAVEEVGGHCTHRGFDFQEDRLDTYTAKMESAHELASQSTKKGRRHGRSLSQVLDAAGRGDLTSGAEWQRAIAALGSTGRFHAGCLAKRLGIPTPSDWDDPAADASGEGDEPEEVAEPEFINYPLDDHLFATHPSTGRPGLAMILRAARRGGKPAVLLMVNALCTDYRRTRDASQNPSNHAFAFRNATE